jgi:hypothetical protein
VDVPTYCGRCDREIPAGEPLLVITVVGVRSLHRCAECEGPAPPDLPAPIVQHATTRRMTPLAKARGAWMPYRDD